MERVAAVVTVSDGVSRGTRDDVSGDAAVELLASGGFPVATRRVVPDERPAIESALRELAAHHALIVTTGGTGFGPRDVTPEATRAVLEREAPGLAELMRSVGVAATPMAALSRAVAGTLGAALIVNLPGSPAGVRESLGAVLQVMPHAVELMSGSTGEHATGHDDPAEGHARHPAGSSTIGPLVEATAVKVHGDPPCTVGSRMSIVPGGEVHGTLGCAEFDAAAVEAAAEILEAGAAQTRTFHHELGDIEVFLEPHRPPRHLAVVSATDVARAIRAEMRRLGTQVILVEPRADRLAPSDEPFVHGIEHLDLGAIDEVVLTDHDAPGVSQTLAALLRSPVRFIGVMGSRRHVGGYVEELRGMGFDEDDLGRIRSPLGLDLGGRSPEEIALSIVAGIVAARHDRAGGWLDR